MKDPKHIFFKIDKDVETSVKKMQRGYFDLNCKHLFKESDSQFADQVWNLMPSSLRQPFDKLWDPAILNDSGYMKAEGQEPVEISTMEEWGVTHNTDENH